MRLPPREVSSEWPDRRLAASRWPRRNAPSTLSRSRSRMLGYLLPHRRALSPARSGSCCPPTAHRATPALIGRLIDIAVGSAEAPARARACSRFPRCCWSAPRSWAGSRSACRSSGSATAGQNALYAVRGEVFAKVAELDVGYFEAVESGDLMSRLINDIEQINSFLSQGFRRLLSSAFSLVATLIAMVVVDWRLALATLSVVPVMLGVTRLFGFVARRAFRRRQEAIGDVSATLAEELAGIKVAQAFNRTDRNRGEFADRNAANRDANVTAAAVSSAFSPVLVGDLDRRDGTRRRPRGRAGCASTSSPSAWWSRSSATRGSSSTRSPSCRRCTPRPSRRSPAASGSSSCSTRPQRSPRRPDAVELGPVEGRISYEDVRFSYRTGRRCSTASTWTSRRARRSRSSARPARARRRS